MSKFKLPFFVALFFVFICSESFGRTSVPLFGPEWTFTNETLIEEARRPVYSDASKGKAKMNYLKAIQKACPACEINRNRVTTPEGFTFLVSTDPYVIEVTAQPMTVEELRENEGRLQEIIWDTARAAGLEPHFRIGGGHIHMDLEGHFENDRRLFRNFMVDLFNHPEIFMGGTSLDYLNAPPLATLGKKAIKEVEALIERFDKKTEMTIEELRSGLTGIYNNNRHTFWNDGNSKYQAINTGQSTTLEIRGFRPQISARHYLVMAEFLSHRIQTLKKQKGNIPLEVKDLSRLVSHTTDRDVQTYKTRIKASRRFKSFIDYIESTGFDSTRFFPFITEELKSELNKPLEHYRPLRCSGLFAA